MNSPNKIIFVFQVAKHLKLDEPGTFRYHRPLEEKSFLIDERLRTAEDVERVVEELRTGPLVKFSLHNIYHPWVSGIFVSHSEGSIHSCDWSINNLIVVTVSVSFRNVGIFMDSDYKTNYMPVKPVRVSVNNLFIYCKFQKSLFLHIKNDLNATLTDHTRCEKFVFLHNEPKTESILIKCVVFCAKF